MTKNSGLVSPYGLEKTHKLTLGEKELLKLTNDIKLNGIKESIKYVIHNGKKYIVDGHHRAYVAKILKLENVFAEEVNLPYAGYKTIEDLLWVE
ncbi:MAG: ParB/Srx family N-terminal domain-containing protein [Clostridia bacterium]|nr:ParB/Srx family N-terminal domain-containing protein [Clostridia bacterium]